MRKNLLPTLLRLALLAALVLTGVKALLASFDVAPYVNADAFFDRLGNMAENNEIMKERHERYNLAILDALTARKAHFEATGGRVPQDSLVSAESLDRAIDKTLARGVRNEPYLPLAASMAKRYERMRRENWKPGFFACEPGAKP